MKTKSKPGLVMLAAKYWQAFWQLLDQVASNKKLENNRLGVRQNRTVVRKHRPDWLIVLVMMLLMLVGLVLIYSINAKLVIKHLVVIVASVIAFIIMAREKALDQVWKLSKWALIGAAVSAFGLFLLALVPGLGKSLTVCALGACRWYRLGPITIQESEIIKLAMVIFLAAFWGFLAKNNKLRTKAAFIYSILVVGLMEFFIVVLQNDLGTGVSLMGIVLLMALMAGVKIGNLVKITAALLLIGLPLAIVFKPHRVARIVSLTSDSGHHITQAKIALGSGGLFGLGIGNSVQSTGYLPEVINDSIFAIVGEITGFFGSVSLILIYGFLLYRLLRAIAFSQDVYARLLIAGATGWIFSHFVINIFSMIGLFPITGITLPFLSYGGTSMVFVAAALGLAFNATRYTAHSSFKINDQVKFRRRR